MFMRPLSFPSSPSKGFMVTFGPLTLVFTVMLLAGWPEVESRSGVDWEVAEQAFRVHVRCPTDAELLVIRDRWESETYRFVAFCWYGEGENETFQVTREFNDGNLLTKRYVRKDTLYNPKEMDEIAEWGSRLKELYEEDTKNDFETPLHPDGRNLI
ncbi:MAG: hypothetical protein A3I07_03480 [Candidatus Doudnabacteria bacterium RIFCSPLOWO2_02_FULL_42_9]|uniref:Uncharacterized protein n=1 Tax=Candidatus Doudnabacteria bacterium RIFCSPHIGHO2_01_FULL_41_86 TaxID=1817821 RepID=A0A1F5N872_9BACT|nr:MAG: hypothetical protein A2717_04645 [Candidatus Doudnabacteria bacterium RIFCSPHIGHO2_01_FULL_41_86]OGE75900.1 MAG: hypothetical protein A3K07_04240 [Candidatus Doudnabacteria bacterium RIFCSPHIGHO2_01_43_10]OGE86274.1 MAG: hypothetical protein A3E28_04000 [Candidatus Doudnabacteria bacterium RIFCSPHIGHO2_12_FULL_42_22]OGE87122.1 MAG: hypothetical protein A3C49_03665 [Candidatus Doudnabacteria bacterium RIFCSPHIGHO2_02_FULL_42_25]OGE92262.1 MAG: hypothetical protein A2895_04350 [Candidatus